MSKTNTTPKSGETPEEIKIKCDVYWCQHLKPNDMSGKYQVNLCNLSPVAVTALETIGIGVQVGEDEKAVMGHYITCKSLSPLNVVDANKTPITVPVGNGSKGVALVGVYDWTYQKKKGKSPSLKKLVINELVERSAGKDINVDDEDVL